MGTVSAGLLKPVTICELKSDNKAYCGDDLNSTANVDLNYVYEFDNGNVVLKDDNNYLYFFDGSQVRKLVKYRELGAPSDTDAPSGIQIPRDDASNPVTYHATPNFVIIYNSSNVVAVSKDGKVIKKDSGSITVNAACEMVKNGANNNYKLNPDGTSSSITIDVSTITTLASVDGRHLVQAQDGTNYKIYLSNSKCPTGVVVATLSSDAGDAPRDAQMVKVGNDFYIAVRYTSEGRSYVNYYKVSGTTPNPLRTNIALHSGSKYFYALDGNGRLYAITAANTVTVYNIDGTNAGSATVASVTFAGLLGLADRVLAKDTSTTPGTVYEITTTGSTASAANKGATLHAAVNRCTDATNTRAVDGAGTNFIRCLYDTTTAVLYSLTYNSGTYGSASYNLPRATSGAVQALFGAGKVLVKPGDSSTIHLCNTTNTPSISCSSTDLPDLSPNINRYLKVNGNDVFYSSGALKVGNIFDPPSATLPFTVSSVSGGNASFDLNRFAFGFTPTGAPCATQIVYFSSRTASPKTYTIAQPSNACVARILKVY
jgi:hypothetical protein